MRQKDELEFVSLLSRISLGYVTAYDVKILNACKLALDDNSVSGKMQQVVNAISNLPSDTVCLLPTHSVCNELNKEMLKSLPGEEIYLLAADSIDCPVHMRQKVTKKTASYSEDSTLTAGLKNEIIIKIGCKVMLRRNIDVTLGLANGAIGIVYSVQYSID